MALGYKKFRNMVTGQVCHIEAGRQGNFKTALKKLVNYIRYNIPRYYIVHLTLTVAENVPEIDSEHLHRVLQFIAQRLKRKESDFKYVAVKEMQERGAIHYHALCVYSKPFVFPTSDEIRRSWGLGFVKLTAPKLRLKIGKIANYIGKYIGKGYEYGALDIKKSFTASQIKQIYKLSPSRLAEVVKRFGKKMAEQFACTYRKVFLVGYELSNIAGVETKRPFRDLIMEFPSEWAYEGACSEPF
ncbi:MAG: rolling circle replication-associated protein [Nitrospirota bacterium]